MDAQAVVTEIERFSLYDGPGIRTTVFVKGCPLHCAWCHNPECIARPVQLGYRESRCVLCGRCAMACPKGVHTVGPGEHQVDRTLCDGCGACVRACPQGALTLFGRRMTAEEAMRVVLRDARYYAQSGGGLTVSGGEPLFSPDFTVELLTLARAHGIHTAVETSGVASAAVLERVIPLTDLFLLDCKETDPARHLAYTGVSNAPVLDSLALLMKRGARVTLRCPIIPGYNNRDDHYAGIAALLRKYPAIRRCECMAYHTLGVDKYRQLDLPYAVTGSMFTDAEKDDILRRINALAPIPVVWG